MKERAILLPLDGTPKSVAALPVAKTLADLLGATLHIAHVAEQPLAFDELQQQLSLTAYALAGTVLDTLMGDPAESIARLATERGCFLTVMAMYTGHKPKSGLGSVAEAVLRRAPCPIVLVPPDRNLDQWRLQRAVLPQDGTPDTASAIRPAIDLAQRAGAALLILHVSGAKIAPPKEAGSLTVPRYLDQPQHEWPAWSEEFLERIACLCGCPESIGLKMFLAVGEPGTEIIRFAQAHRADLIILPWHGSMAPDRAATLKSVMRAAPCPILVLPMVQESCTG
jgi:nucleotide-binding universal stress UspA family protein